MAEPAAILVIDDEPSVALTMQAILEQEGYRVRVAHTAAEARALFTAEPFDAALVDVRIDDADGIQLVGELRERRPDCSAIMLTGYASLESAVRAIRQGAYDYLTKPCDLEELKLTIARAVERGAMAAELRARLAELEAANATIRALADQLQRRVDEATAELSRKVEELSEAKRRLEEAHHQREEFIAMVAHELGQPLTNISGFAQLLGRPHLAPQVQEQARTTIVAETQRLARLVRDLADAARLATGRFQVTPADCDLAAIVRQQAELARLRSARHTITVDVPGRRVAARCDADRIAQVLSNLLTNAITYSDGGEVRVRLWTADGQAYVSVSDQGAGIPPDRLEAIFEPHVRLAPGAKGAGLGLYVARGIVEAHGGLIWAESGAGKGTTVTLSLPLAPC
jgi:signal transduction histidine kinase